MLQEFMQLFFRSLFQRLRREDVGQRYAQFAQELQDRYGALIARLEAKIAAQEIEIQQLKKQLRQFIQKYVE